MVAGLLPPPTFGNGMATIVNGFGLATPAAEIAGGMPAWVAYCMYQVPIMTIAYLPDRKSLLASGYCCTPSAPGSMIPSVNSSFQMVSALTKIGLVPRDLALGCLGPDTGLDAVRYLLQRVLVERDLPGALHEAADAVLP